MSIAPAAPRSKFGRMLPGLALLRSYEFGWLRFDLVAGLTLAAYLLPAAIADSSLAQLPPQAGIYACLFSGLVFWLFCSSRHTAITITSAISLLIGATLGEMGNGDVSRFGALAACTALMVSGFALLVWLFDGGSIVNFVSETVMLGFKAGVALHLASTQLPKLFGISGAHGNFWSRMGTFFGHIGETHAATLWLGLAALVVLVLGKIFAPTRPVALFVVVGGIVAAGLLGLGAQGVKLLGEVPQGVPVPSLAGRGLVRHGRAALARDGGLPARRRRDRGDRAHVLAEARLPRGHEPGVPGARGREPRGRPRSGLSRSAAACRSPWSTRAAERARRSPACSPRC